MPSVPRYPSPRPTLGRLLSWFPAIALAFASLPPTAQSGRSLALAKGGWQAEFFAHSKRDGPPAKRGPPEHWEGRIPLVVTNKCESTVWPGIATQSGTGPGTGGFELAPGTNRTLWVGSSWQGRVWGRTNCTVNGNSCACKTGDCFAELDCEFSVSDEARGHGLRDLG